MKRIVIGVWAACALCLGFGTQAFAESEDSFETGKVIQSVKCRGAEAQSFALYLPKHYTSERAWPVLFAFDPNARGHVPVELYAKAAERYGYIVIGSNNSKNGPREPVIQAMLAVWLEAHRLFNLDKKRIYVTGFSGGARVSSFFYNVARTPVAGIIACGAGLSKVVTPDRLKPALYYGIVGTADFTYREMRRLDRRFDEVGVVHRVKVYEGSHVWPPEDLCLQAVQWMEARAMMGADDAGKKALLWEIFNEELARARQLEKDGKIVMAESAFREILTLFPTKSGEAGVMEAVSRLEKTKYFKKHFKKEQARLKREQAIVGNFFQVFGQIRRQRPSALKLPRLLYSLKVGSLNKSAGHQDIYEQGFGKRILYNLAFQARAEADVYLRARDYQKVILVCGIALEAGGDSPYRRYDYYNLACAYSRTGDKKKALKNLESAVDAGFDRVKTIETDADLDAIRDKPGFAKILAKIKQEQAD